jgi:hypothetical protein
MARVLVSFVLLFFAATAAAQPTPLKAKAFPGAQALPAIAGLIESTRWAVARENKDAAVKIIAERFKLQPQVAERTWEMLADPKFGLAPDARFDLAGFKNVLALRAEIEGDWGGKPPAAERYIDLSYYERALKKLK